MLSLSSKNLFFTADTYFGHKNIIRYCNRPFESVKEMDEEMIARWNKVVPKDGTVLHMGDVFLCPKERAVAILHQLNGNIMWVPGNHDKVAWSLANQVDRAEFRELPELCEITVNENGTSQPIILCHYGLRNWHRAHHGTWHFYGHSHGGLKDDNGSLMEDNLYSLSMDVGVDCNNFQPFTYEEVKAIMSKRSFRAVDHHSAKMFAVSGPDPEKAIFG